MVGASGALWGLMVGGFVLLRAGKTIFPARMAAQMRQRLTGVLVLNIALSFVGGIDKFAHFGGGIAGLLLVVSGLLAPRTVGGVGDEPFWIRALAPLTALLMAGSVVVALLAARPWENQAQAYGPSRAPASMAAGAALFIDMPVAVTGQLMMLRVPVPE
jgi:hypothetical protein